MLLKRQGNFEAACSGVYRNLRELTRHRRRLVQTTTMVTNRVHGYVDTLFPGFLDERQSGVSPFSAASLWLLEGRFSAPQIKTRKAGTLTAGLARRGTPKAQDAAAKLQYHAGAVLTAPRDAVPTLQLSLAQEISHYRCLQANIGQCEREIAQWLAKTPAALLTSVRGIGITLAAAVAGELGDPAAQPSLPRLCSYGREKSRAPNKPAGPSRPP